jgi:hypothetical protein
MKRKDVEFSRPYAFFKYNICKPNDTISLLIEWGIASYHYHITIYFYNIQRISLAIQRGKAAGILSTIPPNAKFNDIFYTI